MCNKFRRAATPLNLCLMPYASFFPVIPALGGTFPAPPDRCSFINRPSHRWPLRRMVFAHADLIFHHAPRSTPYFYLLSSTFYFSLTFNFQLLTFNFFTHSPIHLFTHPTCHPRYPCHPRASLSSPRKRGPNSTITLTRPLSQILPPLQRR